MGKIIDFGQLRNEQEPALAVERTENFYQSWRKAPAFRHGDISHISFVFCIF